MSTPTERSAPSLLVVLTAADEWTLADGTTHPTGFWAEELATPMQVFRDAGVEVTVATPGGVRPTVDQASLSAEGAGGEEQAAQLRGELEALADLLEAPIALETVSPDDYDGVFVPGGHGPMEDLAVSEELGLLLTAMVDDDKVVASVCHGPASMLSAVRPDGTWAFAGRRMAGFTNEEETQAGFADRASWTLEDRIREAGGEMETGPAWEPFSVVDDNVVTGQNPASSDEVAQKTVEALDARAHWLHVVPYEGGWTFKHEHGEPEGRFDTQRGAIEAAKEHGREHGDWELVIHGRSGRIRDAVALH
jgi:putative intracellular protease/amidase